MVGVDCIEEQENDGQVEHVKLGIGEFGILVERLDVEQASESDEQLPERQQDDLSTVFASIQADVEHDGFMVGSLSCPQATVVDASGQEELVFFLDGGLGRGYQEADAIGF